MTSEAKGQGRRQLFHDRRVQDADTADETLESDAADQQGINSLLDLSSVPCRDLEGHDSTAQGRFVTAMNHGDDDSPGELDQAVGTYDDGLEQVRIFLHAPFGVSELPDLAPPGSCVRRPGRQTTRSLPGRLPGNLAGPGTRRQRVLRALQRALPASLEPRPGGSASRCFLIR
jgi:hypothetical protein